MDAPLQITQEQWISLKADIATIQAQTSQISDLRKAVDAIMRGETSLQQDVTIIKRCIEFDNPETIGARVRKVEEDLASLRRLGYTLFVALMLGGLGFIWAIMTHTVEVIPK